MRRILLIQSHLYAGSDLLYSALEKDYSVQGVRSPNRVYNNLLSLSEITSVAHKRNDAAAIYMDEVLHNHTVADKSIFSYCHNVFLVREPRGTLSNLMKSKNYSARSAYNYYVMRLRRLYSAALKSECALLLNYFDLFSDRCGKVLAEHFRLDSVPFVVGSPEEISYGSVPSDILTEATYAYEFWFDRLKKRSINHS